jgi:hypothetical protein
MGLICKPMKIQINSNSSVLLNAGSKRFLRDTVSTVLNRFEPKLTRVEVHLTDVDNTKEGRADKRCLLEVRPAGAPPRTASARAHDVASAVGQAARKMRRSLTTFFERKGPRLKAV